MGVQLKSTNAALRLDFPQQQQADSAGETRNAALKG